MNVNQKGNLGLCATIADFAKHGIETFLPLSGASAIDLIAANEQLITKRIQVKYRAVERDRVIIPFTSVVNGKKVKIDLSKIDGWAVYCADNATMYYIPINAVDQEATSFSFRITEAKTKQPNVSPMGEAFTDPKSLW